MANSAIFTAVPYVGHLNPLLRLAVELQRRGWRVAVAEPSELAAHVAREAPSVPFIDLGPLGPVADLMRGIERRASAEPNFHKGALQFLPMFDHLWPLMFDGLTKVLAAQRPTLMVVDIFSWAGFDAAEVHGVPIVINNPSLLTGVPLELLPPAPEVPLPISTQSIGRVSRVQRLMYPFLRRAVMASVALTVGRQSNRLRRTRGLPPVRMHEKMRDRPILVNGAFGLEYPRRLPPNISMTGPLLPESSEPLPAELESWVADGSPVVYVNLGTVVAPSDDVVARLLGGVTVDGTRTLWVMKAARAASLPKPLPPSLRLVEWLPSTGALLRHPNVRAFVSHCGINSVYESLAAGTPIVGLPFYADQRDMAMRVADAGVGRWLDKSTFTAMQLRDAIGAVVNEPTYRDRIPALQASFTQAGGVRRAADIVERSAGVISHAA